MPFQLLSSDAKEAQSFQKSTCLPKSVWTLSSSSHGSYGKSSSMMAFPGHHDLNRPQVVRSLSRAPCKPKRNADKKPAQYFKLIYYICSRKPLILQHLSFRLRLHPLNRLRFLQRLLSVFRGSNSLLRRLLQRSRLWLRHDTRIPDSTSQPKQKAY